MSAPQDPRIVMLLGVPFHDVTMTETLDYLDHLIAVRRPSSIRSRSSHRRDVPTPRWRKRT